VKAAPSARSASDLPLDAVVPAVAEPASQAVDLRPAGDRNHRQHRRTYRGGEVPGAGPEPATALAVFEQLGSVREAERARAMLAETPA
jgi:hypothetical protein